MLDGAVACSVEVSEVYSNEKAIVTIISDDEFYPSAQNINEIFGCRGLKCTVAGAVSIVNPNFELWKTLLENGTINLVSHSYNHIRMEEGKAIAYNAAVLKHEIIDADIWFEEEFGKEQIGFVCPENQICEIEYKILSAYGFWTVRRRSRGFNPLSPKDEINEGIGLILGSKGLAMKGLIHM